MIQVYSQRELTPGIGVTVVNPYFTTTISRQTIQFKAPVMLKSARCDAYVEYVPQGYITLGSLNAAFWIVCSLSGQPAGFNFQGGAADGVLDLPIIGQDVNLGTGIKIDQIDTLNAGNTSIAVYVAGMPAGWNVAASWRIYFRLSYVYEVVQYPDYKNIDTLSVNP